MIILEFEDKAAIASMQEDELIGLHFGLGLAIRNAFGWHEPGSKLLASCDVAHPDDAAGVIIRELCIKGILNFVETGVKFPCTTRPGIRVIV